MNPQDKEIEKECECDCHDTFHYCYKNPPCCPIVVPKKDTSAEEAFDQIWEPIHVGYNGSELDLKHQLKIRTLFLSKLSLARKQGYEEGQDDAFEGRIQHLKTVEIRETVNVPQFLQDFFRKQGREDMVREVFAEIDNSVKREVQIEDKKEAEIVKRDNWFFNLALSTLKSALEAKKEL